MSGASLGTGCPYRGRYVAAPWQWGIHVSDLHHPSKPVGLSSVLAPSLCCGAAASAQTRQIPSLPHVQRQARVTGLLLQASPRIVHHHPALPRTRQFSSEESTSYAAAALLAELLHEAAAARAASAATGGQGSGAAPLSPTSSPHTIGPREGRTGQPGTAQLGSGAPGAGRAGRTVRIPGDRPSAVGRSRLPIYKGEPGRCWALRAEREAGVGLVERSTEEGRQDGAGGAR